MMAPATSSLHWPINVRPKERAAKALYSNGQLVSTMVVVKIYWSSVFDLPAYAIPKPKIEHCLMIVSLEFWALSDRKLKAVSF